MTAKRRVPAQTDRTTQPDQPQPDQPQPDQPQPDQPQPEQGQSEQPQPGQPGSGQARSARAGSNGSTQPQFTEPEFGKPQPPEPEPQPERPLPAEPEPPAATKSAARSKPGAKPRRRSPARPKAPAAPTTPATDAPETPASETRASEIPASEVATPQAAAAPETPGPETLAAPETPAGPEAPAALQPPALPETPAPEAPPGTPAGPETPAAPEVPAEHQPAGPSEDAPGPYGSSLVGSRVVRREDVRLLTGQGRYLDDLGHTALAAAFLRSPHAHARILDIDVTDALDVDGLVAIYTWDDLEASTSPRVAEPLPLLIPHPALTHPRTGYPLARDEVNHVGEPIVMVVARDRYVAEDIVDLIQVEYESLPPVVGVAAARAAEHLVHPDVPGNVAAHQVQDVGNAPAAIAAAPHMLDLDLDVERSASMPLEGRGVLARWDSDEQSLRIWSSTQTSTGVRAAVAAKLGLPLAKVHCTAPDVGGGFGVKIVHPWPEEVLVPWAARELGQDVKWVEDRREHFISSAHERQQLQRIRVGFDDDGRILGLDVKLWHDNGAYTPYGIIVPIISATQLLGPYKPGAYRVEFTSLYTNTVLVTPYRGAGRPQGVFAMERTMDAIADALGKDRAEVRAVNFIQPEEMPYDHGLTFQDGRPLIYDSGDYPATLAKLKALVGWDEFAGIRAEAAAAGRRIGIGLACYVEGTGVGPYEGAHVQVETSGRVNVAIGLTTQGQGHETAFAQIVADVLGVRLEDVHVTSGDTRRFGYAVGTFASRAAVMSGNAVARAATLVREKALRIAAEALEVDPSDLEIVAGDVRVKGAPGTHIPLTAVSVLSNPLRYAFDASAVAATQFARPGGADPDRPPVAEGDEPGLEATGYYSPPRSTFANGMHAAVVETDPDTAEIRVLRYCVVHDCGTLVNPMIVEGQIHGGVAQGVGGALYERMVYDEDGQLLNASFMDFLMPYASEVPTVEIDHLETPSPLNPLGIKGAGEAGVIPGMAVFAAAIEDAEGFPITRMPISPSELFELRAQHAAGRLPPLNRTAGSAEHEHGPGEPSAPEESR